MLKERSIFKKTDKLKVPKVVKSLCSTELIYNWQNSLTVVYFSPFQTLGTIKMPPFRNSSIITVLAL